MLHLRTVIAYAAIIQTGFMIVIVTAEHDIVICERNTRIVNRLAVRGIAYFINYRTDGISKSDDAALSIGMVIEHITKAVAFSEDFVDLTTVEIRLLRQRTTRCKFLNHPAAVVDVIRRGTTRGLTDSSAERIVGECGYFGGVALAYDAGEEVAASA